MMSPLVSVLVLLLVQLWPIVLGIGQQHGTGLTVVVVSEGTFGYF